MNAMYSPFANQLSQSWWLVLIRGLVSIAFGLVALAVPGQTIELIALLCGVFFLADGIIGLGTAFSPGHPPLERFLLVIWALLSIGIGVLTFMEPIRAAMVLILFIGIWAIFIGVVQILTALRLRKSLTNEWLLVLIGILSLIFGISVIIAPGAGALSLLWLIALYAIAVGFLLVLLAFRLRGATKTVAI